MSKDSFPLYTMHFEGNIFVKHISSSKCITVSAWPHAPAIRIFDYVEINTGEFDEYNEGQAQPIPKARFDIERQQVISQLIHG